MYGSLTTRSVRRRPTRSLFWINLFLGVFNLLPAYPADGGRMVRALLARRMDQVRATRRAVSIGQGFAMAFILGGIWNTWLMLVGFFLFATLVASGMPMLRTLHTLEEQTQDDSIREAVVMSAVTPPELRAFTSTPFFSSAWTCARSILAGRPL